MLTKKLIYALPLALVLGILLASCVPGSTLKPTEPTILELSKSYLELSSKRQQDLSQPLATVESNQPSIKAWAVNSEWIEVEAIGNGIYLKKLLENKSADKRNTTILVMAGEMMKTINVVQLGTDGFLEISESNYNLSASATKLLVSVKSNVEWDIDISEELEWIRVTKFRDFVEIQVLRNTTFKEREGHVYITANGTTPKEITIRQEAFNNGAVYNFPLLKKEITLHEILDYEDNQGSYRIRYVDTRLGEPLAIVWMDFLYSSPIYDQVSYYIVKESMTIHEIVLLSSKPQVLTSDEYIQALKDQGFELDIEPNKNVYKGVNKELGFEVTVDVQQLKQSSITFKPIS